MRTKFELAGGAIAAIGGAVVNVIRHSRFSRALLVALMLASWLVLTNHCALAGLLSPSRTVDEAPSCCHRDRAPSPAKDACPEALQCCKTAKAMLTGKPALVPEIALMEMLSAPIAVLTPPPRAAECFIPFDHGPPRVLSFAEQVLQRSLTSHAPPSAA